MPDSPLPDGWRRVPLGDIVASSQYGLSLSSGPPPGVPMLRMNGIGEGRVLSDNLAYVEISDADLDTYRLDKGDILFNRTNSQEHVGKTGVFDLDGDYVFASYLIRIKLDRERADPAFVNYAMNTAGARQRLRALSTKGVSQSNINPTVLKKAYSLVLPPLAEQRRVAAVLATWDRALARLDDRAAALRRRQRGLAQRLLTGKTRLPGFTDDAISQPLGTVFRHFSKRNTGGRDLTPLSCSKVHGIVPQTEIFNKRVASEDTSHYKVLRRGDLVYDPMLLWDASLGFLDSVDIGVVSPAYATFHFDERKASRDFFRHLLDGYYLRHQYKVISQGTNARRRKAMPADFLSTKARIPDIAEQRAIAAVLAAGDREIALTDARRAAVDLQKRGLMQRLLSGAPVPA